MHEKIARRICTILLFFAVNFGLWEVLVYYGVPKEWASFDVYAILFVLMIVLVFLSCLMMSCFTPIIEECTFREAFLGGIPMEKRKAMIGMSIVSILVFDVIHLYRW